MSKEALVGKILRRVNVSATPQQELEQALGDPVHIAVDANKSNVLPDNYGLYLDSFPIVDNVDKLEASTYNRLRCKGWEGSAVIKIYWTGILNAWVLRQQVCKEELELKTMFEDVADVFVLMAKEG